MIDKVDRREILELLKNKAWLYLPMDNQSGMNYVDNENTLVKTFAIILRKQDEIIDKLNSLEIKDE